MSIYMFGCLSSVATDSCSLLNILSTSIAASTVTLTATYDYGVFEVVMQCKGLRLNLMIV